MFKNDNAPKGGIKNAETVIGASVKVTGDFTGQGNVIVEGELEGSLKTDGDLSVGDKAKILANIKAKNAIINGEIKGNVSISGSLDIGSTGKIFGDVETLNISIEPGGVLNGRLTMSKNVPPQETKKIAGSQE